MVSGSAALLPVLVIFLYFLHLLDELLFLACPRHLRKPVKIPDCALALFNEGFSQKTHLSVNITDCFIGHSEAQKHRCWQPNIAVIQSVSFHLSPF